MYGVNPDEILIAFSTPKVNQSIHFYSVHHGKEVFKIKNATAVLDYDSSQRKVRYLTIED